MTVYGGRGNTLIEDADQGAYWDSHYLSGARPVSRPEMRTKAEYVLARLDGIESMIDWGCGNGDQLEVIYKASEELQSGDISYCGTDISMEAIRQCRFRWPHLYFIHRPKLRQTQKADLSLSIDVLFHQVTEDDFIDHLDDLFTRASKRVIIHSTNTDSEQTALHVKHWWFTPIVALRHPGWELVDGGQGREYGTMRAFYTYEKL